ncbi:MAG TPA: SGNH/GDSL hydrolase family protein [Verrucomicrobiales bacterium]|nr:SGNH/GDSL hydrolase family protein [Verrucomicrobiales bacterium]
MKLLTSAIAAIAAVAAAVCLPLGAAENPVFAPVEDRPDRPNVLLIGDSISIGYTLPVRELLAGKADLFRIPENGGPTANGLAKLNSWLGTNQWDVIHFNWGLHDLKFMPGGRRQVPLDDYEQNLEKLVARLKKTGATLIWCSTTPVPPGRLNPPRLVGDDVIYNLAARRIMERHGIAINDLYSFALARQAEIQNPADVHFSREGSAILGRAVAFSIRNALSERPKE